ncbi:hypothetical protein BWQ96_01802 [Gracilariopsis chorda]|uniref:EamA domain-containing protein n=1 Tax=Gracilariopsis chorda TaxID=448386 RepID=A0A2V3J2K6_9FLOR|nr:hypothetical protein BWQ96_01802 [Gracilariopsis chorda]|eukprot:PXF48342.1 hypothetical protein BWQ96_01802 [Gracilariopsis chorda]
MLCCALAHSTLTFLIRLGATRFAFPALSTILIRSVIDGTLSSLYIIKYVDYEENIRSVTGRQWLFVVFRGVTAGCSIFCQVTALKLISMGNAVTLLSTCPTISTVMAAIFLSEPVGSIDVLSLITSFVGVVLVAQPSFLHFPSRSDSEASKDVDIGYGIALAAAWFTSSMSVATRFLGRSVNFMVNVLSLAVFLFTISLMLCGPREFDNLKNNIPGLSVNILAGICGCIAQSCLSKSLQFCRAGPALLVRSMTIPFSYCYGLIFLGEKPSLLTLSGVAMVVAAVIALSLKELRMDERFMQSSAFVSTKESYADS